MLKSQEEKLGFRELIALFCITVGVKYVDMTVVMMYKDGLNATWMIPIFSFLFIIIPYLALMDLLKRYNLNFIDLVYKLTGNFFGFIILMLIFLIGLISTFVNSSSYSYSVHSLYMQRTPMYVIHGLGWLTCLFIVYRGFKNLAKGSYLLFWYIKFFTILFIILAWREGNIRNLLPIFGPGMPEILKSIPKNSTMFIDLFFLSIFYSFFKNYTEYKKGSIIGFIIVLSELTITFALFAKVFYYRTLIRSAYPFQQIAMNVGIGRFISNLEIFFLGYWIVTGILRFSVYLYTITVLLSYTIKVKDYKYLFLPVTTIIFLLGIIPNNQIDLIIKIRNHFIYQNSWIIMFLPILLWIISKFKGGDKGEVVNSE